jgi:hypothetical protein
MDILDLLDAEERSDDKKRRDPIESGVIVIEGPDWRPSAAKKGYFNNDIR